MDEEKRTERFNHLMTRWIEYCTDLWIQRSPTARRVWDCKPYEGIVRLGPDVLPLVREAYDSDVTAYVEEPGRAAERAYDVIRIFGLEAVVARLCDGFSVPDEIRQDIDRREDYAREELERYLTGEPSAKNTPH